MKAQKRKFNARRNSSGFITLDFIFAFFLAYGFAAILFTMCAMLAMVEVGQYFTFAASRAYNGAHETPELQAELAKSKYSEVRSIPVLKQLFSIGWMELSSEPELGNFNEEYPIKDDDRDAFVGARVKLDAKMLHLNIPFIGLVTSDSDVGKATLNSYLMREVSTFECREQFNRARWEKLKSLDSAYSQAQSPGAALITDNGC